MPASSVSAFLPRVMTEEQYSRITYDITLRAAETLARLNTGMTFVYVSGAGTDSTEHGRTMWARVKGRTENALLRLPFKAAFMFRPGVIVPRFGARSKHDALSHSLHAQSPGASAVAAGVSESGADYG